MADIGRCPICAKPIAFRFSVHDCAPSVLEKRDKQLAGLIAAKKVAARKVDARRAQLIEAEGELRTAEKAITQYWRDRGARG